MVGLSLSAITKRAKLKKEKTGGGIPRVRVEDPNLQRALDAITEAIERLTSNRNIRSSNQAVTFQDLADNGFDIGLEPGKYPNSSKDYAGKDAPVIKVPTVAAATVYQFTEYFESADIPPTNGTYVSTPEAHGMTGTPTMLSLHARCTTAEQGYSIGDEIWFSVHSVSGLEHITLWADDTYVGLSQSDEPNARHKTANSQFSVLAANWQLVIRAWR